MAILPFLLVVLAVAFYFTTAEERLRIIRAVPPLFRRASHAAAQRVPKRDAFDDALDDPLAAIDAIAALPQIDRILTSGGEGPAADRCRRLAEYAARAAAAGRARARPPIETIAGGGVDEDVLSAIARTGCVREVHVGRAARDGVDRDAPVSAAAVRRLRRLLEGRT